jgi:hypothetical protein
VKQTEQRICEVRYAMKTVLFSGPSSGHFGEGLMQGHMALLTWSIQ